MVVYILSYLKDCLKIFIKHAFIEDMHFAIL